MVRRRDQRGCEESEGRARLSLILDSAGEVFDPDVMRKDSSVSG